MSKNLKFQLLCGSIPFVMLVFMLPLADRIHPVILGLPFVLFWIFFWVLMTPLFLYIAYRQEKKSPESKGGDK